MLNVFFVNDRYKHAPAVMKQWATKFKGDVVDYFSELAASNSKYKALKGDLGTTPLSAGQVSDVLGVISKDLLGAVTQVRRLSPSLPQKFGVFWAGA